MKWLGLVACLALAGCCANVSVDNESEETGVPAKEVHPILGKARDKK